MELQTNTLIDSKQLLNKRDYLKRYHQEGSSLQQKRTFELLKCPSCLIQGR
jgi:hypothetical protein